jgi:hypothetical protein
MDEIIDIGKTVICDLCNTDYTNSDEPGGMKVGCLSYCPKCEAKYGHRFRNLVRMGRIPWPEVKFFPLNQSFKQTVLELRNGDNTIRITSFDN